MRTNIYIRKEDEKAWAEIEDKPSFIHAAIVNAGMFGDASPEIQAVADAEPMVDAMPNQRGVGYGVCRVHKVPLTPSGKCLQKGCNNA